MLQQELLERNKAETNKERLFRLFHTIIHNYSLHPNIYHVLLFIEILQFIHYALHPSFQNLWATPVTNILQKVLGFTDLSPLWNLVGGLGLLIFTSLSLFLNVGAFLAVLYEINKDAASLDQQNVILIKFLTNYYVFLKTILLIPMTLAFSAFISPDLYGLTTTTQAILATISILGLIAMAANTVLIILFFRNNSPFSKLPFSSSVNYHQQIRVAIKILIAIYGSFAQPGGVIPLAFAASYFAATICFLYMTMNVPGLIKYPYNRIYQSGILLAFWTILSALMQMFITSSEWIGLILWLVGIIVVPMCWNSIQTKRETTLLSKTYKTFDKSSECLAYNYYCIALTNERTNIYNLLLLEGILNLHIQSCNKPVQLCNCARLREQLLDHKLEMQRKQWQQERKMWFEFLRSNLFEAKQKYQSVREVYFLLAYIQNQVLDNKFRALFSLQEGRKQGGGIKYDFLNYYYLREIEIKMKLEDKQKNEKKPVDVNRYYRFQIGFGKLQEMMEESTYQHIAFWELLKSEKATRKKIYEEGVKIHQKLQKITQSYAKLIQLNSSNIHCLVLYGNFMKVIVNSNQIYEKSQQACEAVKRAIGRSFKIQSDVEKEKYGENSVSAIVIISGERSSIGVIKYCSSQVGQILGYASHQLLGQNINILMPKFIGNMHDDVLRNYLELSQSQYDYVERLVPMIDANNFMTLARVLTKPLANLLNGLELVGIFNSVLETSLNHPNELPKYALYRSDTGQVQALSQSCFSQFNYKINKIDENHETSSELTFSSLFCGVKQSDLADGMRLRCKMLSKHQQSGDVQEVQIELFQRLHIHYYSVDLRLLCFYTQKKYKQLQNIRQLAHQPLEKVLPINSQREGSDFKYGKSQKAATNDKAARENYLHQITRKPEINAVQPTNLKLLRYWGYIYHLVVFIISLVFLLIHINSTTVDDYFSLSKSTGEVMGDIAQIAFNARMMQVSAVNSSYGDTKYFQNNISISLDSLKSFQYKIGTIYLNYDDFSSFIIKEWSLGTNKTQNYTSSYLDTATFNYVTVASTYQIQPLSSLNFSYGLLKVAVVTRPVTLMFQLRVNGIFELIPLQTKFNKAYLSKFDTMSDVAIQKHLEGLIGTICGLAILCVIATLLGVSVINSIHNTILLFGHIARFEIDRQIQNCSSFLEIFYQDSYLVGLKKRQIKTQRQVPSQFQADQSKLGAKKSTSNIKSMNMSEVGLKEQNTHGIIKANVSKIEFLEKELQLRTEGELMNSQSQNQNENQLLRAQGDSTESQVSIYQNLSNGYSNEKCTQSLGAILLLCIFVALFCGEFLICKQTYFQILDEISHLQTGYSNLNSIKLMKLFALQSVLDNSEFMNYPLPNASLNSYYQELYNNQRIFDTISLPQNLTLFPYYYTNICAPSILSSLASSPYNKLYFNSSFNQKECQGLLQGMLGQGLRLGIVGYTESLLNITHLSSSTVFSQDNFQQSRKMQKYIQSPLRWYIGKHSSYISQLISSRLTLLTIYIAVEVILILVIFCQFWRRNINDLHERLAMSRAMLGFIPVRVFVRNQKLTKQYQQYIGQLIE